MEKRKHDGLSETLLRNFSTLNNFYTMDSLLIFMNNSYFEACFYKYTLPQNNQLEELL